MKKWISVSVFLLLISRLEAHGPHVHGNAHLQMAIDGNHLQLLLQSPGDTLYGFEHHPKNEKEKKAQSSVLDLLKNHFEDFFTFDQSLQCRFTNLKLELVKEEEDDDDDDKGSAEHQEVHGEWKVDCKKSPQGTTVAFHFSQKLPRLNALQVDVLSDQKQNSKTFSKGEGNLQF